MSLERDQPAIVRPDGELDKPAVLERFRAQMIATARRYSAGPDDADDAYQRAAEILLTHSPSGTEDELCRWLRTTVKHEALAIRRQRQRVLPTGSTETLAGPPEPDAHELAEQRERSRFGAQALSLLKPQEIRCLLLKAEGYSYQEICRVTGWTYTKVNRCLTEGRRAFASRFEGIESGAECDRLAPALSAFVDGELADDQLGPLRAHLSDCAVCRAALRSYRSAPSKVAALAPPAALTITTGPGRVRGLIESLTGAAQQRLAGGGERYHQAIELVAGQKATAAAACCAVALAGGGAVTAERLDQPDPLPAPTPTQTQPPEPTKREPAPEPLPVQVPPTTTAPDTPAQAPQAPTQQDASTQTPRAQASPPAPPPQPAQEFSPVAPTSSARRAAPAPAPAKSTGSGGGSAEFAP